MRPMSWKAGVPKAEQPHAVVVGNIEAARGTCSELVEHALRSGGHEVLTETRLLMRIGEVRNVSALTAYAVTLGLGRV